MTREQLLAEVSDVLRSTPTQDLFNKSDQSAWVGRASAVIERWDISKMSALIAAQHYLQSLTTVSVALGLRAMRTLLHQAQADLQMELGRTSVVVAAGQVFEYFEELRQLIKTARVDVFFVDPYLEADFVSHYLPSVAPGVSIRLLARHKITELLPAVDMFQQQTKRSVEVRSSEFHDRYLFVDRIECYFSSASFKDGAKHAPTLIAKVTDAFQATWNIYDGFWQSGTVHR